MSDRSAQATRLALAALAALAAAPGAAQDAANGGTIFNRQCVACHVVQDPASGEVLAGRNARTGPNLYGVAGRTPGSVPDFRYSDAMVAYGATGAVWEEANFVPYSLDPTAFLRDALDDPGARSLMTFKLRKEEDARDVWAFLAGFGGEAAPAGEGGEGEAPSE